MLAVIALDPDLWVSSNKGHLPFIASAREMSELGDCGIGEASEFRGDSVARNASPNPLESREPAQARQRSGHQSACFSQSDGRSFKLPGEVNIDLGRAHRSSGKTRPGAVLAAAPGGD